MTSKRVLVAPLDWGLGHATRCIPIIKQLLEFKCQVIIAGSGSSLAMLKIEFPLLSFEELPAYDPAYSAGDEMIVKMIMQLPKFIKTIRAEHRALEKIVDDRKIDVVISDNRYGCWSDVAKSIFITHQLNIILPRPLQWLSGILNYYNHKFISRYHFCWVPDNEHDGNLSGEMSNNSKLKITFIGLLSRFNKCLPMPHFKYEVLVILSGPEPQRSLLETILMDQIKKTGLRVLVVRGVIESNTRKVNDNIEIVDFLNASQLNQVICESEVIITRSGYSTVMDLAKLEKLAIFIPTPGQTEQEYLAKELHKKLIALSVVQHNFDLQKSLLKVKALKGFKSSGHDNDKLKKVIADIIQ
jgi:uncharacterized protein (TIGR00661 family)